MQNTHSETRLFNHHLPPWPSQSPSSYPSCTLLRPFGCGQDIFVFFFCFGVLSHDSAWLLTVICHSFSRHIQTNLVFAPSSLSSLCPTFFVWYHFVYSLVEMASLYCDLWTRSKITLLPPSAIEESTAEAVYVFRLSGRCPLTSISRDMISAYLKELFWRNLA